YEVDLDELEELLIEVGHEVMKEVQGGVADSEIFVRYKNFDDAAVGFHVILRSSEFGDQFRIRHEYLKRLHRVIRVRGIAPPYWPDRPRREGPRPGPLIQSPGRGTGLRRAGERPPRTRRGTRCGRTSSPCRRPTATPPAGRRPPPAGPAPPPPPS